MLASKPSINTHQLRHESEPPEGPSSVVTPSSGLTTVVLDNIPMGATCESAAILVELLAGRNCFDFIWLQNNLSPTGRVIVNMRSVTLADLLMDMASQLESLRVSWSPTQGLQENVRSFSDSISTAIPSEACPMILDEVSQEYRRLIPDKVALPSWEELVQAISVAEDTKGDSRLLTTPTDRRRGEVSVGKVFVGGLSLDTDSKSLRMYFAQFGRIEDCAVVRNFSGLSRRFGFCKFVEPSSAAACLAVKHHYIDGVLAGVRPYTKQE